MLKLSGLICGICPLCSSVLTGMEGDMDLQFLLQGGDLLKVRSSSWKKTRYFRLQEDCKTMWHESKKLFKSNPTCECCPSNQQACVWDSPVQLLHICVVWCWTLKTQNYYLTSSSTLSVSSGETPKVIFEIIYQVRRFLFVYWIINMTRS